MRQLFDDTNAFLARHDAAAGSQKDKNPFLSQAVSSEVPGSIVLQPPKKP